MVPLRDRGPSFLPPTLCLCICTCLVYLYVCVYNILIYCYSNMERIMQTIMVDTEIEQDRQILLTHNGCMVTRSTNPNSAAATVNYLILLLLYHLYHIVGWL